MKPSKKKTLRIEKAKKRIMAKGKSEEQAIEILKSKKKMPKSKTLEEFLNECEKPNAKHKLEVNFLERFLSVFYRRFECFLNAFKCSDKIGSI